MNEQDSRLECSDYWNDNDDFPIENWQYEVANADTRLGYHDWIESQKNQERR